MDLENQYVELADGARVAFEFDEFRKYCLLNGLDDVEYVRACESQINEFRKQQKFLVRV